MSALKNLYRFELTVSPMAEPVEERAQGYNWRTLEQSIPFLVKEYAGNIKDGARIAVRKINEAYRARTGTEDDAVSCDVNVVHKVKDDKLIFQAALEFTGAVTHYTDYEEAFNDILDLENLFALNREVHPKTGHVEYKSKSGWIPAFSQVTKHVHTYEHVSFSPCGDGFYELLKCTICGKMGQRKVDMA